MDACRSLALSIPVALGLALPAPAVALEQKLIAADGAGLDQFGSSVAIEGDTAVVGAPTPNAGSGVVYLFTRAGDRWSQTAKLMASDGAADDRLGSSVAIEGDTIVAGSPGDAVGANAGQGSAYTFTRAGDAARSQTAKLTAADGAPSDVLGLSVAIDGDTIVAGAPFDDVGAIVDQGSAYTFARTGAEVRTQTAKLTVDASFDPSDDRLGVSVAIDGDTIVAGALYDNVVPNVDQGSAFTFARTGAAARTPTAMLTASDGAANDQLGSSVAIERDGIVAGAPADAVGANVGEGSAYTFARTGAAARTETAKLTAADGAADDAFGGSVAIEGDAIVAGAPSDDVGANADQGSTTIFFAPAPVPPGAADPGPGPGPGPAVTPASGPGPGVTTGPGPGPGVAPGACANIRRGTNAAETLMGTPAGDALFGLGGRDLLSGLAGDDCLSGGSGPDWLVGGSGSDRLQGEGGNDVAVGGPGRDRLLGGSGSDRLRGDSGDDVLSGGAGNDKLIGNGGRNRYSAGGGDDTVNARNRRRESVDCGPGRDKATVDRSDQVRRCERVSRR